MRAGQTIAQLAAFDGRGAGSDGERRAALWLAAQLREAGAQPRVETFWCRPNWALAQAWHGALALAGALLAVHHPTAGLALVLAALVCVLLDGWRGTSPGRLLTPQRASQNVVVTGPGAADALRLIITANYDAGRAGLVHARPATAVRAALRRATAGRGPGWLAWLALALVWIAATAALRIRGASAATIGPLAVVPSAALVLVLALLLEAAAARPGPAANDNASGTAVALALFEALAASGPDGLAIELVLTGAHEGGAIGLSRYLSAHRPPRADSVVLGIAACGAGAPAWWRSDGPLLPHAPGPRLRALAAPLGARAHRGRGRSPAYAAYAATARRGAALTLGAVDARGLAPGSHRPDDTPDRIDPAVLERVLAVALALADALGRTRTTPG